MILMIIAKKIKGRILVTLILAFIPYYITAQNNPYKIKDDLYEYFIKSQQSVKEKKVLVMTDTLFSRAKKEKDSKAQCLALSLKGDYYYFNNDLENLKIWKERLGNFARKTPYTQYVFGIWGRLINYYINKNMVDEALKETQLYQQEALKLNDAYGIGSSFSRLGNLYIMNNSSRLALNEFFKGVDYFQKNGKQQELYNIYGNIANAYNMVSDYVNSAKYWEKALETSPGIPSDKGKYYVNLAYNYFKIGDTEKALKYINMLDEWKKKYGLFGSDKNNYYRLYILYMEHLKQYDKALLYCDSLKDQMTLFYKSSLYYQMGEYKKAFDIRNEYLNNKAIKDAEKGNEAVAKYSVLFENEKIKNEKNLLEIKNNRLVIEQLEAKEYLLASEKDKNNLLLVNTKLELSNKSLDLRRQKAETERQKANMKQIVERHNLEKQKSKNKSIITISIIIFLLVVTISLLALIRTRYLASKRLKKEIQEVKIARNEAEMARNEAEKARNEAIAANNVKTLFLQNMSHEIRTPLNAIVGFSDVITDSSYTLSDNEKKEFVKLIHTNNRLLINLINDILDISRLESGAYELNMEDADANTICSQTIKSVKDRVQAGVELIFVPYPQTIWLHTDVTRISQLLINLLTNACKYTEKGSVTLAVERKDQMVLFSVTDTGCGIAPENAERIFDRFEKLGSFKQGTGLGLNICRIIARLLHGDVKLDTNYSGGSRFLFTLPA